MLKHTAELQEDLEIVVHLAEEPEDLSEDQKSARSQRELQAVTDGFRRDIASLRKDSRAALLALKRAIDTTTASKREELLRSAVMRNSQQISEGKITEDALMKVNNDVTEAMRRTLALMQGELERSVLSTQMLDSSTASLKSTADTHDTLTNLLGASKQLITALEKTDWMDRLLILAALAFFMLVVLFILKQRIVDRSLRIAFFWTRFIPSGPGKYAAQKFDPRTLTSTGALPVSSSSLSTSVETSVGSILAGATTVVASLASLTTAVPTSSLSASLNVQAETKVLASEILPEETLTPDIHPVSHDEL